MNLSGSGTLIPISEKGILVAGRETIRIVTHCDVTEDDIRQVIRACGEFFRRGR